MTISECIISHISCLHTSFTRPSPTKDSDSSPVRLKTRKNEASSFLPRKEKRIRSRRKDDFSSTFPPASVQVFAFTPPGKSSRISFHHTPSYANATLLTPPSPSRNIKSVNLTFLSPPQFLTSSHRKIKKGKKTKKKIPNIQPKPSDCSEELRKCDVRREREKAV